MTMLTIADGRQIEVLDIETLSPHQATELAKGIADFLVRSGQIRDDVAILGPQLLQFLSEAADMAAQQHAEFKAAEQGRILITGRGEIYTSRCGVRYVQMIAYKPYRHEVRFSIVAKPGQSEDDLTAVANSFLERKFDVMASVVQTDDGLSCTTDDLSCA